MVKHKENEILQVSSNRGKNVDCSENLCYNNINMDNVKLLSVENTAGTLGVSRSAIYNFINSGELKAIKLDSRTMIRLSDLTDFIESRERYVGCLNEI